MEGLVLGGFPISLFSTADPLSARIVLVVRIVNIPPRVAVFVFHRRCVVYLVSIEARTPCRCDLADVVAVVVDLNLDFP